MNKAEQKEINGFIYSSNFEKASQLIEGFSIGEVYELVNEEAYKYGSITFYGFFAHLLSHSNYPKNEVHFIISSLLSTELCLLEGAYDLAEYHIKEAIKISPDKSEYKVYLKNLKGIPR
jgi:hypothetical protein